MAGRSTLPISKTTTLSKNDMPVVVLVNFREAFGVGLDVPSIELVQLALRKLHEGEGVAVGAAQLAEVAGVTILDPIDAARFTAGWR
jgi:hypothetical protein